MELAPELHHSLPKVGDEVVLQPNLVFRLRPQRRLPFYKIGQVWVHDLLSLTMADIEVIMFLMVTSKLRLCILKTLILL